MTVAVVTDELSDDPETALELAAEMGLRHVELRGIGGRRVPRIDPVWEMRLPELLRRFEMRVVAISPGLFKIPLPAPVPEDFQVLRWQDIAESRRGRELEAQLTDHSTALMEESIAFAARFECPVIAVFGFEKPEHAVRMPEAVPRLLADAARKAAQAGITLALENEHICWADTGERTAALVREIGSPNLRVNWDPGNAYRAGETPFPDGYRAVRGLVGHVHVKDARRSASGAYEWAVHGGVDWEGQLHALRADGYQGSVVIETHVRPKIASARITLRRIEEAWR
jgi:sugar phosphate isomerase/epimerase